MNFPLMLLTAYVLGSIPTSIWVGKVIYKKDVRDFGSGNAGATNVYRVLGWKPALAVALVDIGKGAAATALTPIWFASALLDPVYLQLLAGSAAILGHCYTCFAGFRGGKGVATAAGMMAVLYPIALPVCLLVFIVTVTLTRYVSLGSILAALALPVTQIILIFFLNHSPSMPLLILSAALVPFILFTHRANIPRIINGTENQIGSKAKS